MLSWLLHFCFSCFGVSSDLRVKKIRAGGCWVGLAAASCAPSCPFPWAPTPEPFQCQGSPGAALCSPGAWGCMELEVARSCFMQWGSFLLTCSKSLAVVPVTAQCIWGRFPSHSSRTGGEKDLFAFGFRNQAWELWYLLSCFRCWEAVQVFQNTCKESVCQLSEARFYLFPAPGIWV